jgi:membrane fusion protein (multidrug efflux system)
MKSGQEKKSAKTPEEKGKRQSVLTIFAATLIIAAVGGLLYWLHARHYEDTDDAQIDANLSPIGTRIDRRGSGSAWKCSRKYRAVSSL